MAGSKLAVAPQVSPRDAGAGTAELTQHRSRSLCRDNTVVTIAALNTSSIIDTSDYTPLVPATVSVLSSAMHSTRQLAYAPTPYIPRSALNATINLDEEAKLSTTNAERDLNDSLAEIYSIIITLDGLEKAFLKDSINESDYTETCSRLLKQYKSNLADETIAKAFGDLDQFKREWDVCRPALRASQGTMLFAG